MDIEAKIWGWVGTGSKLHSFVNGQALCRSSYKQGAGQLMDFCEAKQYGAKQYGVSVCTTCEKKFNAAIERLENSMQPSTGEGDYLPPAEETVTAEQLEAVATATAPTVAALTVQGEELVKVIEALRTLRFESLKWFDQDAQDALNVLDNAGVFRAIDEASGYDLDPAPAPVSKCTCTQLHRGSEAHSAGCPGDPAEWGDMAYTQAPGVTVGSEEWHRLMGSALAEAPLYALRKNSPEPDPTTVDCTCGPGVAAQFGHRSQCPVTQAVLEARSAYPHGHGRSERP